MKNTTLATKQDTTGHKTVRVIARVEFKKDPRKVVYFNRSSDGKNEYQTSLFNGKATACNCPAKNGCYHKTQCEELEAKRVVVRVGEVPVSGVTASHAVEKALRLVEARRTVADVDVVAQACEVVEELPELPIIEEETFDNEPLEEEEFSEDVAEQWTEQEIAAIRAAAQIQAPRVLPQVHKYENAPLNGGRGFSLMR